jgi:hypothetical protein
MIEKKLYYNTQREPLHLPEYGRHIQEMVEYIKKQPSKEERNRMAQVVINVMANLTPSLKDNSEYRIKLWNHLAQISNYELDIDYPVPIYKKEDLKAHRKKITYPDKTSLKKHYGYITEQMAKVIAQMPETEERNRLLIDLANHMKKQYLMYKKEAVNDEQILSDLRTISNNNELTMPDFKLNETRDILYRNKSKQNNNHKKNKRRSL